jgi:hypothetical protein
MYCNQTDHTGSTRYRNIQLCITTNFWRLKVTSALSLLAIQTLERTTSGRVACVSDAVQEASACHSHPLCEANIIESERTITRKQGMAEAVAGHPAATLKGPAVIHIRSHTFTRIPLTLNLRAHAQYAKSCKWRQVRDQLIRRATCTCTRYVMTTKHHAHKCNGERLERAYTYEYIRCTYLLVLWHYHQVCD